MTRPDCFEFAMEFLGSPEDAQVRAYVERLERALQLCREHFERELADDATLIDSDFGDAYAATVAALESNAEDLVTAETTGPATAPTKRPPYWELVDALTGMACQYLEEGDGQIDGQGVSAGEHTVVVLERLGLVDRGRILQIAFDSKWLKATFPSGVDAMSRAAREVIADYQASGDGDLDKLVKRAVHDLALKFGVWVEIED